MPYNLNGKIRRFLGDFGTGALTSATKVVKIVPDDDHDLPEGPCRAISCEEGGLLYGVAEDGSPIDGFPLFRGTNPVSVRRVHTTTTAYNMWANY